MGQLAQLGSIDGATTRRALLTAATVASYCVEGVGTERVARLTLKDVERRLAELRNIVHVE